MKQEISPVVIGISAAVLICLIIFIATRVFGSSTSTVAAAAPPPTTIHGQQIPAGAPTAVFQQAKELGGK